MVKVTYQRPSGSRDTTTIAGFRMVTSTSGHDHTNRSGAAVLARRSTPPRIENALNALCWWRSACCNGTEETSDRNTNSGSFFIAVSAASDAA